MTFGSISLQLSPLHEIKLPTLIESMKAALPGMLVVLSWMYVILANVNLVSTSTCLSILLIGTSWGGVRDLTWPLRPSPQRLSSYACETLCCNP